MRKPPALLQWVKLQVVTLLGRDRANKIAAPYHDFKARYRTKEFLTKLTQKGLLVNLGCGYRPLLGWINVDRARGPGVDVVWDLTRPLPFPPNSCSAIFSEHVIEHLQKPDAEKLARECYRVLQPGGVVRLSTPDAERYLLSYATDRAFLFDQGFSEVVETPLERINIMMREYGQHLWVYDAESLSLLLRRAGFAEVLQKQYRKSLHPRMAAIDSEDRAFESLYIEAVK